MPFLDESRWYEIYDDPRASSAPRPGIFLDRDGVVIEEKHYLQHPDEVEVYPGVAETLASLSRARVSVVLVTNQAGIGRGLFQWDQYHLVHARMLELLGIPRPFAAVYANSYRPEEIGAEWRKPKPGMFLQAAADLNISLGESIMVGDKLVDLMAAGRAGIARLVHVRSGHGEEERPAVTRECPQAEQIDSLAQLDISRYGLGVPGTLRT